MEEKYAYQIPLDERVRMIKNVVMTVNPCVNFETMTFCRKSDISGIPVYKDDDVLVFVSDFLEWYLGYSTPEFYWKYRPRDPVPLSEWLKHSSIVITSALFHNTIMSLRAREISDETKQIVYRKVAHIVEKVRPVFKSEAYKRIHNMPYELKNVFKHPEFKFSLP